MNGNVNSLLSKSILEMDQFIVERVNINQSNVLSRRVWLFTLSPDKQSLLLFSNQPIQLKTRSACVLVAGTQRNFFTSLSRWGTLVSWSSTNQGGPRPCPREAHFWTCKIRMKQWKTFFTYLSSAFMGSSSLLSSSDSSKSNSLLLGLLFTSSAGMMGFAKRTSHSGVWQRPGLVHAFWSSLDLTIVGQVHFGQFE